MKPVTCAAQEMDMRTEQAAKALKRETALVFLRDQRSPSRFAVTRKLEFIELKPGILRICLQGHGRQEKL